MTTPHLVGECSGRSSSIGFVGSLSTGSVAVVSEFAWWPLGWVLLFEGQLPEELLDVTGWANFTYDTRISATITLHCHWLQGKFPLDFRHPQKLEKDVVTQQAIVDQRHV
jgi:hypothetical protein